MPPPSGNRGLQWYCDPGRLTPKVLFGLPLRQTTGVVESLLDSVDLDWVGPGFSTLGCRLKTLNVSLPYRGGTGLLNRLIDSAGIEAEGEGPLSAMQASPYRLISGTRASTAVQSGVSDARCTSGSTGESPTLPVATSAARTAEPNTTGSGCRAVDGAYDTRKYHDVIAARNARAVILPRKNAKPCTPTSAGAVARNEAVDASRYLGKALWRRLAGYRRRSRVERKMTCIELLGQSVMARAFDWQGAVLQIRTALRNRYTALGIPATEAAGKVGPGKGEVCPSPDLCNKAGGMGKDFLDGGNGGGPSSVVTVTTPYWAIVAPII